jgi:hypothetical protein
MSRMTKTVGGVAKIGGAHVSAWRRYAVDRCQTGSTFATCAIRVDGFCATSAAVSRRNSNADEEVLETSRRARRTHVAFRCTDAAQSSANGYDGHKNHAASCVRIHDVEYPNKFHTSR